MTLDTKAIEAELAAITRGEWHYDERVGCVAVYAGAFRECLSASYETFLFYRPGKWAEKSDGTEAHWTADEQACKDAVFIAHAPAHVRKLLDRVTVLEEALRSIGEESPHIGWDDVVRHWVCFDTEESSSCRTCGIVAALNRAEPH